MNCIAMNCDTVTITLNLFSVGTLRFLSGFIMGNSRQG